MRARTTELEARNSDVLRQAELLRDLSWRLLRTQDNERRHIARELHDSAGQTLTVLGMLPAPLVVKVRDAYGNGIAGVPVTFSDKGIGGTFSATPVITDSTGRASVTYTAGPTIGTIRIYVSAPGVPSITYTETIIAPSASISRRADIQRTAALSRNRVPSSQSD